jgi:predicted acylesterase/phospholipase RssA
MRSSRVARRLAVWALFGAFAGVVAGCADRRPARTEAELLADRERYAVASRARADAGSARLLQRAVKKQDDYLQGRTTVEPTFNILVLSGGGDYGAFGAGFLQGWAEVRDPNWTMPEFDLVTGVSTGALLAPFALLGDRELLARATELYSTPQSDWVRRRGLLFFLPGNRSLLRIDGLERDIRREINAPMVDRIIAEWERGRMLVIGTTNLDLGLGRMWDLGAEAAEARRTGADRRVVDILLASSAIPGAFPPVEIDGHLYTDGAVVGNILYDASRSASQSLTVAWQRLFPGRPVPRTRCWVIINNKLAGPPEVVQPTWTGVTAASLAAMIRATTVTSLEHLALQAELIRAQGLADIEVRYVAVPEDFRPPAPGMFQQATMSSLAELGRRLGAEPGSWKSGTERVGPGRTGPVLGEGAAAGPARAAEQARP